MTSIRKFAYAALLAAATLTIAPTPASAQEAARGRFTLTHDVRWGGAKVPAGEYEFSFNPDSISRVLSLTKLSGARTSFMMLVPATDGAKSADSSLLLLTSSPEGSYVSAMQLPQFGMTLHFAVPAQGAQGRFPKAGTTASAR